MPLQDEWAANEQAMFSLDSASVHQYDLRTVSALKKKPRRAVSGSASQVSLASGLASEHDAGKAAAPSLRAQLRPLLASASAPALRAPGEKKKKKNYRRLSMELPEVSGEADPEDAPPPPPVFDEAELEQMDEDDAMVARLGLQNGEDAVNYFTAATKDSQVKFVHLVPVAQVGVQFLPYSLDVVPAAFAVATGDYYTMSRTGLVHCVLQRGANATECIPMSEWVRHSTFFNLVRSISYFKNYVYCKTFAQWRSNVRRQLYAQQRRRLQRRLLLARASFCAPLVELKQEVFELRRCVLVTVAKPRSASEALQGFLDLQAGARKDALAVCEATMRRVVDIAADACAKVQQLDKGKIESEDPRKRLDMLMANKLEGKNAKARSMNAAVEEKKALIRLAVRASEDRDMLSDFVRLADTIMVETVIDHALHSLNDVLLGDFLDPGHKVGLFEVMVGFKQVPPVGFHQVPPVGFNQVPPEGEGMATKDQAEAMVVETCFSPTLVEFFDMTARLADETIFLLTKIPRVLDARGCGDHCTSASAAAKFDVVVRPLPRFLAFLDRARVKFLDDFRAAQINATTFDVVRPIFSAHAAFDVEAYRRVDRGFLEARSEFEEVVTWQKELDKMRTRDSIGTIEVTSRQLRTLLTPFIEQKQDCLKAVIRDEAHRRCREVLATLTGRVRVLEALPLNLKEFAAYVDATKEYDEREMRKLRAPIDQMYALLVANDVKLPPDDLVALDEMHSFSNQYSEQLQAAVVLKQNQLTEQNDQLDADLGALEANLVEFTTSLDRGCFVDALHLRGDVEGLDAVRQEIVAQQKKLDQYAALSATYRGYKDLFGAGSAELPALKLALEKVQLVDRLWALARAWRDGHGAWTEGDLTKLRGEDVDRSMQVFGADAFALDKKIGSEVSRALVFAIAEFQPQMPLVMDLGNPAMLARHWERLFKSVKKPFDPSKLFTLSDFVAWGIASQADVVSEVSGTASGENQLDQALAKMEKAWDSLRFSIKPWRSSHILVGVDEIQQELDDQIVKTQAMRSSRFVKPFLKRVSAWESMLTELQDIVDNWLKVQAAWLYLEPIFSSDDIMKQIPTEGRLFKVVNQTWIESMAVTVAAPAVLAVARRADLRAQLVDANSRLDRIQKGLNDYLETKRLAFPRFFFLSNDELLEILAETKDPTRVQPHLKKCFDGISALQFTERLDIVACYDGPEDSIKSEKLDFAYQACHHKPINPRDSGGNVEKWLVEVEAIMKKSLAHSIDESCSDFYTTPRTEWLTKWQGQTILTVNQVTWVNAVESAISGPEKDGLLALFEVRRDELMDVVISVRGEIPKRLRETLGALVVMDVHNRDITSDLAEAKVSAVADFDWQAQLRYYWAVGGRSAQSGMPESVACKMINATILYAYEYIGNCGRLVITPLTDRCYRTLMGAIHLNLGGAPEGPAGTGKTETTKDLGKAIAIQCVVTNCSDGLDYKAMGKFFKGLAASGAWACFDEFNRIQLEVLSVIAQQVLTIQQAKARRAERFMFEGTDLPLKMTCCPFITMNPGYAGRAELPDNLKVLFRTVAMMVPDYAMIGEIILYSMGYTDAKAMAVKIVTTYKLCSEQLSSQSHYDYGMRAVVAVLRAAGNLKRAEGHLPEDVLVLRSIIDVNLPKFLSPDVPLFGGITSDLFPGVELPEPDRVAMKSAFHRACSKRNLQPTPYFWDKVVQIYDMMVVRHGFMIVGAPFSGKTMAWKVLADSLATLHDEFPADSRWSKVVPFVMNPKSVTMGQLYGQFDPVSTEWTDGVLAINYRNAATSKVGGVHDRKWVLLDGPVDAIWIENMNTVLDDNKKLCLMSGEIIAMSDVMSMIFEPMDLLVASPATVSRCGMVYMEPEQLGWQCILDSWLDFWKAASEPVVARSEDSPEEDGAEPDLRPFELYEEEVSRLRLLCQWLVLPCLCFVRRELKEMTPTVDSALLSSLLNLMACFLKKAIPRNPAVQTDPEVPRNKHLEASFLMALVWSVGVTTGGNGRDAFSVFLRAMVRDMSALDEPNLAGVKTLLALRKWVPPKRVGLRFECALPPGGAVHDWCYVPNDDHGKWIKWIDALPKTDIAKDAQFAQILIPTECTAQISFMLNTMLPDGVMPLVVGPTGTGKSVCAAKAIASELPQGRFKSLSLGFSAKTSANMTQDIIDGQLTKRRKGVFGPPLGQILIAFVDDLNMPEVETYGAQPPIELLRQLVDAGGYYDLKEKTWQRVVDTVMLCAMGPAGGGRNATTPRLLRHFHALCFSEFDDGTLVRIFGTIVDHFLSVGGFSDPVKQASSSIVSATLQTYREAMKCLLPTPAKSHYVFNLRDFARVVQGVLMIEPAQAADRSVFVRLWTHEALRVFADRLTDETDRDWFVGHARRMYHRVFELDFDSEFAHLRAEDSTQAVGSAELRQLFFGNYMVPTDEERRPYAEVRSASATQTAMDQYLQDFNAQSRKPMDLVMFNFAIAHVSRISRILQMPGGNALLVGVGGSGRQSVSILATAIAGYVLKRIEISKNYGVAEWRDDVKVILREAGSGSKPVVFLFSDTQIQDESYVEDVNNMLNSGQVPNLFASDEKSSICEAVRPFAKLDFGRDAAALTPLQLYEYFVSRVRARLHIVLAFSPIGDAFRDRLRKFPSLVNCCAIDWFTAWPGDALVAVADKFLAEVDLEERPAIVEACQYFHLTISDLSDRFRAKAGRINYVTPTSYLELIRAFKDALGKRRATVAGQRDRYNNGLEQLASAESSVATMQQELTDLQPVLKQSQMDTDKLMAEIEAKLPGVRQEESVVGREAAAAQKEADVVQKQVDEVQADLDEAIPALNDALKALDTIKPSDIDEVRKLAKPPATVKLVAEAICVMLGEKPVKVPDALDPSKKVNDFWPTSQKMLNDKAFISRLKTYDKDNIPTKVIAEIRKTYMTDPAFTPDSAKKASAAAAGLCKWCYAMNTYDRVAKVVGPKKEALAGTQANLDATMAELDCKKASLAQTQGNLQLLQAKLEASKQTKSNLASQVDLCGTKLVRAKQLIQDLGGEKFKWTGFVEDLERAYTNLTGDVLVSAGLMAYLGPFTSTYREGQMADWVAHCVSHSIPCSAAPTLTSTLGSPLMIRQWVVHGLPTDGFSVDNGIIVFNARRWPLMIDPQGQANKWVRNMEEANNVHVLKLTDDYMRTLENAIQFGQPVLLENVGEELDPTLEPLLLKQIFKNGGLDSIRLGDSTVQYSEHFRFYMTTKLRNPHYLPETSVKVTLLNFMITPVGLGDQLLGVVVEKERPDLERKKNELVAESATNAAKLKDIEDRILEILSGEGNILEDETAIETLGKSKITSDEILKKQALADQTESEIDEVRSGYKDVALETQVLFFCITDLNHIEPTYSYSLPWFVNLFISSILKSEQASELPSRLANLARHFDLSLYNNVCRSLLEKDKLLFSFVLAARKLAHSKDPNLFDAAEWIFLLTGGVALDNPHPNSCGDWLLPKQWNEICLLSDLPAMAGLRESFSTDGTTWKRIYDSASPQDEALPGRWEARLHGLKRLCLLRCIRPDKVMLAVQKFVVESLGAPFVRPPPFDLQACYDESVCTTPLVFVLSPGSDPMSAVFKAAETLSRKVYPMSLGQGQGPLADKLIATSCRDGSWVVLQNCHLAPSFMPRLEQICETLTGSTHKDFRLWCTTYPSPVFPVSVLQNGVKMTIEPPKGLRANILGSFSNAPISDPGFFDGCNKPGPCVAPTRHPAPGRRGPGSPGRQGKGPSERQRRTTPREHPRPSRFRKLVYALCMFHALLQERRLFGPLGWNIAYGFNESDMLISMQQLGMFLDENAEVPFKALKYCIGECNYGGRVTDGKDRITLNAILHRFFRPQVLPDGAALSDSGVYTIPTATTHGEFVALIEQLPNVAEPEIFGFHSNANITKSSGETNALFATILLTEGGGGGGGGASTDEAITATATDILKKLPPPYDMERAQVRYPVRWDESMNTVLCQELLRFNTLVNLVLKSLKSVVQAVSGVVVMSADLDQLGAALVYGAIPALWKAKSYPSFKPLSSYVNDLVHRLDFFASWLDASPPPAYWLSAFFFQHAFLTASKQNFARKETIPIDAIDFRFEMLPAKSYDSAPNVGVYAYGLFLEGARWDASTRSLDESEPKVLFATAPTMYLEPMRTAEIRHPPSYACPVYKTSDRRGVLATTGHSTNFILDVPVPSAKAEGHWVQRGVAFLSQLDD